MSELTFKFKDVSFVVKEINGLYDLNDLRKQVVKFLVDNNQLKPSFKSPRRMDDWKKYLSESEVIAYGYTSTGNGRGAKTLANKQGLVAYAAWLNVDFKLAVEKAFCLLLDNKTQEAAQVAHSVVFDLDYANSVNDRWKMFIKWCYSRQGFGSINKMYGANVVRMVMNYSLGHHNNASIKGESAKTLFSKLIDLKHGAAIQSVDAQLGLLSRELRRKSTQAMLKTNKGKMELYQDWKLVFNWREDEEFHKKNKKAA